MLQHKHEKTQRVFRMARQAVRELRGRAAAPANPDEAPFEEAAEVAYWTERDRMALAYYYEFRLLKQYMARDFEGCVASARVIDENFNVVMGMAFSVYYLPYQSLALIALLPKMTTGARRTALRTVRRNQRRLRTWSRHAPENYRHKWLLVEAELARLSGRVVQAEQAYEQAIALAGRHGALPDEALANELAGEFELARGRTTAGRAYLAEARDAYRQWGAWAWVEHLEQRHADLFGPTREGRQRALAIVADGALFERDEGAGRRRRHHAGSRRDLGQDPGRRCRRRGHRGLGHERRRDARPAAADARRRAGHPGRGERRRPRRSPPRRHALRRLGQGARAARQLCRPHARERGARRRDARRDLWRRPVHRRAPPAVGALRAAARPRQASRRALCRERPGARRLHRGPHPDRWKCSRRRP